MNCNKIVIKLVSQALSNKKKDFHAHIVSKHSVLIATSLDHDVKQLQNMKSNKMVIKLVSTALANKKREDFYVHIVSKHSVLKTASLGHVVKKLQIMNCNKMLIKMLKTALANKKEDFHAHMVSKLLCFRERALTIYQHT